MPEASARRRSRRRSSRRLGNAAKWAIFCALAAGAVVAAVVLAPSHQPTPPLPPHSDRNTSLDAAVPDDERRHPAREVYPFSVVPGGVYTTEELAEAVADDPAVAEHYSDVAPAAMRVEVVGAVREAYMSYRIGDRIFWTKRKLALREGERILTDDDVSIRARCGNRLSDVAMTPTSDVEPAADEFERDAAPFSPVGPGPDSLIASAPPRGIWPRGSVPPGMASTSDGGSPGAFFDGGGFYGDVAFPPIAGTLGGAPDSIEPDGEHPPIVFVLPPAPDAGHPGPPDRDGHGDVPSIDVEIPGLTHVDPPGDGFPGGAGDSPGGPSPGGTTHVPGTFGGSDGELPPSSVVPEPATLTLLGTGLLWGMVKRHRRRASSKDADRPG